MRSGSVNVYERIDSAWTPVQYISAKIKDRSDPTKFTEDRSDDDEFGSAVGIADTHFVIGAPKKSINDQMQAGAVYAYQIKMGSNPMEEEFVVQLVQAKPVAHSEFGAALACTRDIIAVSAPGTQDFFNTGSNLYFKKLKLPLKFLGACQLPQFRPLPCRCKAQPAPPILSRRHNQTGLLRYSVPSTGQVSERLKEQHWKCCIRVTVSWVRIPPCPLSYHASL